MPGQPPGPVGAAAPVGVDPGIRRVAQHVDQASLVRGSPDDLALAGAGPLPHPDLHLVPGQEPQHRMHRAQLLEQPEHQPDDRLDLLIGIQGNLAGGPADIPGRQRDRQFPAAGLGQPAEAIRCLIRCSSTSYAECVLTTPRQSSPRPGTGTN